MSREIDSRRETIRVMVNEHGTLSFQQLRDAFPNVSDVTLRKDLQYLNDTQQAVRTHGGIKSIPSILNYYYRSNINIKQKQLIADKAVKLIRPGDSVFISAGTTCAQLASRLPNVPLKVFSEGIFTVNSIPNMPNYSVEMLGGEVDLNVMSTSGVSVFKALDYMHFNIAFLSTMRVNADFGFAVSSDMNVAIRKKVIEHSEKSVVLMDSTKFDSSVGSHFIPFSFINAVVTDNDILPKQIAMLEEKGIQVL